MQKKLAALRRYHNIPNRGMAELLGITERSYINKEKGVTQFKANEMFRIARMFEKDISEIFLPTDFTDHEVKKEA